MFEHVAVADGGARQRKADRAEESFEAEIRHDSRNDAGLRQPRIVLPALCNDGHQLVAVDHATALVDDQHAVGVAVERDADIGAHLPHFLDKCIGSGRADIAIDVEAVGLDADGEDFRAELPQSFGRNLVGGAVGAIDDDAQAFKGHVPWQRALGKLDVARAHVVDAPGAAEIGRLRQLA